MLKSILRSWFVPFCLSFFLLGCNPQSPDSLSPSTLPGPSAPPLTETNTPLPSAEDALRLFYGLINDHRIPEAVAMLSPTMAPDESSQQAWAVQFNHFRSAKVLSVEPGLSTSSYKVSLEVTFDPQAASLLIPNYGYEINPNLRWLTLIRIDDRWFIDAINTGP